MQLLMPGQETYMNIRRAPSVDGQPGAIVFVVLVSLFTDGVSLTFAGHPILNRALPVAEGRAYLQYLKDQAAANTPMWLIVERAGLWTSAASVADDAEQDLIDDINTTLDQAPKPQPVDVSDLDGRGWNAFRQQARSDFTRTRVNTQQPTPAELGRIRAHENGIVTTAPGQPWTLLRAIVRRGLAVEHEVYGRHMLKSVRLNARGLAVAEQESGVAV